MVGAACRWLLVATALSLYACGSESVRVGFALRADQGLSVVFDEALLKVFGASAECVGMLQTPASALTAKPCETTQVADLDSTCYIARMTLRADAMETGAELEVPAGRRVFFAAVFDDLGELLARGCIVDQIEAGKDEEVTITLLGL